MLINKNSLVTYRLKPKLNRAENLMLSKRTGL